MTIIKTSQKCEIVLKSQFATHVHGESHGLGLYLMVVHGVSHVVGHRASLETGLGVPHGVGHDRFIKCQEV